MVSLQMIQIDLIPDITPSLPCTSLKYYSDTLMLIYIMLTLKL